MNKFIADNKAEILKAILVLLPLVGLGGLSYEQQKEIEQLRTTVVVEHEPVEVTVTQDKHSHPHNHAHTHPEILKEIEELQKWH